MECVKDRMHATLCTKLTERGSVLSNLIPHCVFILSQDTLSYATSVKMCNYPLKLIIQEGNNFQHGGGPCCLLVLHVNMAAGCSPPKSGSSGLVLVFDTMMEAVSGSEGTK